MAEGKKKKGEKRAMEGNADVEEKNRRWPKRDLSTKKKESWSVPSVTILFFFFPFKNDIQLTFFSLLHPSLAFFFLFPSDFSGV